jgi:UPF0716 protein FxsA
VALWLFLLFVVLPFVDLVVLLKIGDVIGFWPTLALAVFSGMLGGYLAKREGTRVFRAWRDAVRELRTPEQGIIDGILVFLGAGLLMAPGVITDGVGFIFLIPFTRKLIAKEIRRRVDARIARGDIHVVQSTSFGGFTGGPFASDFPPRSRGPSVVETSGEAVDEPVDGEDPRELGPRQVRH